MSKRLWDIAACLLIAAIALTLWLPTIRWGLPSREADRWLFGGRTPWTGAEIVRLLNASKSPGEAIIGADVDATPIIDRSKPVILNGSDACRAEIVQRFRLMSGQPDEFIQFKALAEMSQRTGLARLDPRLYQYGGLWIYPVGGLVRAAMAVGWIETPPAGVPAREFYLDRPDAFGKFYIVGRAYSMMWGVVAALAVYALARNACSRDATPSPVLLGSLEDGRPATSLRRGYFFERAIATCAAIAFALLPAVRTAAHEAKPHLAGTALCLLATLAASYFVETGRRRWLIIAGVLCGAAMAMVVSMALSLAVLPAMAVLRSRVPRSALEGGSPCRLGGTQGTAEASRNDALQESLAVRSLVLALAVAAAVYLLTNPFVLINAIVAPRLLRSNLGNSTAMYGFHDALSMIPDAMRILGHAMTLIGARVGLAVVVSLLIARCVRKRTLSIESAQSALVLAVPATVIALQFVLLASHKPAEYARFGLVPIAAMCVAAAVVVASLCRSPRQIGLIVLPVLIACLLIPPIGSGHIFNAWKWPDDDNTALQLDTMRQIGGIDRSATYRLGVAYEPAPWSAPPVNLFDQEIVLVKMTPEMLEDIDAVVWPMNLESQLFTPSRDRESLDWRENHFGIRGEARDGDLDRWRGRW